MKKKTNGFSAENKIEEIVKGPFFNHDIFKIDYSLENVIPA